MSDESPNDLDDELDKAAFLIEKGYVTNVSLKKLTEILIDQHKRPTTKRPTNDVSDDYKIN